LLGLQKEDFHFSHPEFHKRESTLMSSRNATRNDFEQVVQSLVKGLIQPGNYITHRTAFNDITSDRFDYWLNPQHKVIKAMVSFD